MSKIHNGPVEQLAFKYRQKGYKTIINVAEQYIIPDLLMLSPKGKLIWIEIEDKPTKQSRIRFRNLREHMKFLNGEFRVQYLSSWTRNMGWVKK